MLQDGRCHFASWEITQIDLVHMSLQYCVYIHNSVHVIKPP